MSRLFHMTDDAGVKDMIRFLVTRDHMHQMHWLSAIEWRRLIDKAGFDVSALYGWFDRKPYRGGEDMIWVCSRREMDEPPRTV